MIATGVFLYYLSWLIGTVTRATMSGGQRRGLEPLDHYQAVCLDISFLLGLIGPTLIAAASLLWLWEVAP